MGEDYHDNADLDAMGGTTEDCGLDHPSIGAVNWYRDIYKIISRLNLMLEASANALRVYKDSAGALKYGVYAGLFMDGATARSYAGASNQALTDDATNYIYLTTVGTLTINTTGFPAAGTTPHVPLATIATGSASVATTSGLYAHVDITDYRGRAVFQAASAMTPAQMNALVDGSDASALHFHPAAWSFAVPGTWEVAGDFASGCIAGCDQTLDLTQTEAAAAYCKVYDASDTYYNLATASSGAGYTANYQLFPDTELENDAVYFGHTVPFVQLAIDNTTQATYGADSVIWEYWNGSAWSTLTIIYDHTDADDQDGDRPFQQDGAVVFSPPSDWASTTVDSQAAYWVRARVTAAPDITQIPVTNSVEHKVCTPADPFTVPYAGKVVGLRLADMAATVHTTADVKFRLVNFTSGAVSDELTFPQDKRTDRWDGAAFKTGGLTVAAGDTLGVLVTQEDGTNEVTNATVELDVDAA